MRTREALRSDDLLGAHRRVLQEMARGAPLASVLVRLTEEAEAIVPEMRCSVLLLRDGRLHDGAAPSMPPFYRKAIDGLAIGPNVGSCGAAAYHGRRVVVRDVLEHSNWADFRSVAQAADIRATWSEPILCSGGAVLGTFAMYYREPREPSTFELEVIGAMAQIAGIAIESDRTAEQRRASDERFRQVAENIREVFWLTEWHGDDNKVLYISPAYETVYGRTCQSLYDEPRSWSYDIHVDDRQRVVDLFLAEAARGGYDIEYRIVRADGGLRWIHDRAFPIRNECNVVYRVAGISEDITARKQAELELARAVAELEARSRERENSLQTELLLAEERERRRLAVDLHDGLNQLLTLAQMKLTGLRRSADPGSGPALDEIERIIEEADLSARNLTFQLSPPVLHDLGFEAAVQWLVEDVQQAYGLSVKLVEQESFGVLDKNISVLLFRAARELLINVAKHARASLARVRLRRLGNQVEVIVEDDGVAFNPTEIGGRGLGLSSIRERLESLGGRMQILSARGRGTAVTLLAPLNLVRGTETEIAGGDTN